MKIEKMLEDYKHIELGSTAEFDRFIIGAGETEIEMYLNAVSEMKNSLRNSREFAWQFYEASNSLKNNTDEVFKEKIELEMKELMDSIAICYARLERAYRHAEVLRRKFENRMGHPLEDKLIDLLQVEALVEKVKKRICLDFMAEGKISISSCRDLSLLPTKDRKDIIKYLDGKDSQAIILNAADLVPTETELMEVDCTELLEFFKSVD